MSVDCCSLHCLSEMQVRFLLCPSLDQTTCKSLSFRAEKPCQQIGAMTPMLLAFFENGLSSLDGHLRNFAVDGRGMRQFIHVL
jgi:hypothetical protein